MVSNQSQYLTISVFKPQVVTVAVIANDCCACVVSTASTLYTLAKCEQNYLEQSLTAYI